MFNIKKFRFGFGILPKQTTEIDSKGELEVLDSDSKLRYHNGTSASPVVTESHSATLTNKTIDFNSNTILNLPSGGGGGASYSDVTIPALNIDWATGTTFYKSISSPSTFTFSNIVAGKTITVVVYNSSSGSVDITLPTTKFESGYLDTIAYASSETIYTFTSINGSVYASSISGVV
jgi:hypothetical protein